MSENLNLNVFQNKSQIKRTADSRGILLMDTNRGNRDNSTGIEDTRESTGQWFHGVIDRRTAEQRLLLSQKQNSFLLRESQEKRDQRNRKCYVLSYLGSNGVINHFRVQYICGHFYIGSKAFTSLTQLIRYYSHCSDLLKNERLVNPIPAQEPLADIYGSCRRLVAVLPYSKMADTDELSFRKGDVFVVHNDLQNGWLWVTNHRTLESGLVFGELLEQLDDNIDENECYQWFHTRISKQEAVDRLARAGPGSFLVRPSDNSPGNYSLFFHIANSVQRFRIERKSQNRYLMGGRVFQSLEEVINRYKNEQIVEGFKLERPVLKSTFYDQRWTKERAQELQDRTDVYQTIRESREEQKKNRAVLMSGYLMKKSQKQKKWKNYYFVLNKKEMTLFYFENERRTRPKGLIDLNYSYLYACHDSLFDRQNCFQVVERALPCISTVYYLCSSEFECCRQWQQSIQSLCPQQQQPIGEQRTQTPTNESNESPQTSGMTSPTERQSGQSGVRQMRSLFITLLEASGLPVKCCANPYVEIQFNSSIKVARTQVRCPPDPIWEEDYVLEEVPIDVTSFSFVLYNKGKHRKDTEIAETSLELSKLGPNEEFEQWFQLSGLCPPIRDSWGQLRARIRFQSELILSFREYWALKDLILMSHDLSVISVCEQFCQKDRQCLANAVLKIAKYERKEIQIIKALIQREVSEESDVSTLFRANSLTTALIDLYMKSICQTFLRKSLLDSIQKVLDSKVSCELNPCRLDSPQSACENAEHLLEILDKTIEQIFHSLNECPQELRTICRHLQNSVQQKWPNDYLVRTRVVSGFVFLRLICPAILNPRVFGLINEIPSETASRTLILIAKSVQNLSNLIEFGNKSIFLSADRFEPPPPPNSKREPWMEIVNPFILKNKSKMIKYLDDLSQQSPPLLVRPHPQSSSLSSSPSTAILVNNEEPSRELALIHSICDLHKQEVQEMSTNNPTLKKLFAVIEMLSKHKQRFQELLSQN